jgi:hypothetical protein
VNRFHFQNELFSAALQLVLVLPAVAATAYVATAVAATAYVATAVAVTAFAAAVMLPRF